MNYSLEINIPLQFRRATRVAIAALFLSPLNIYPSQQPDKNAGERAPAVAGQFYPANKGALAERVDRLFLNARRHTIDGKLVALLVPHAGYEYSGTVAAEAYKSMSPGWKTFVLIGPSHHEPIRGAAIYARGSFVTPLGKIPVDEVLAAELLKNASLFEDSRGIHAPEHSLETQLPFLQRVFSDFKIVPILMNTNDPEVATKIGEAVANAATGKNALIVISSDLSHYPPKDTARKIDLTFLRALQRLDPFYLSSTYQWLMTRGEPGLETAACGFSALMAGLSAAKTLGANKATLWRYANSGELTNETEHSVGYSAVAFTRSDNPPADPTLNETSREFLLSAARASLSEALEKKPFAFAPLAADPAFNVPTAVFVTLWKNGKLRGCVGSTEPRLGRQDAVRHYARAAAFQDPRFKPLDKNEFGQTRIEISILTPPTPAPNADAVVPGMDGVTVEKEGKAGLFLPDVWIQLPKKEDFLSELCSQKAGLPPDCWKNPAVKLSVFRTQTFKEED